MIYYTNKEKIDAQKQLHEAVKNFCKIFGAEIKMKIVIKNIHEDNQDNNE